MIIRLKYFDDSINIVVFLAPGYDFFFSTKCARFSLTFTE